MKQRKKPALRFKGFVNDWEQRKLEDLASFSKGSGYSKSDLQASGTPIVLYGRLYTKYETVIKDIDTFVDALADSVYSQGGEVIVPASGETAEDISIASVVEKPGIVLGGDLNIIHPTDDLDSTFLAISISHGNPHKEMAKRAQGKSVVHLHNNDLAQIKLWYPSVTEQRKISQYFSGLDTLITLHQRKLEKLQNLKKAMLEKMFPKNGAKVPEIRFKGFTDDWEQRKLGDYVTIISGDAPSKFDEGNELYVKVDDLNCNSKYVIDSKNKVALHESINKAPEGSVVFPKRGAAIMTNKVRILADDCYIDTNLMALSSNKIDSEFLYNIISKEGLYKIADTSTIPQINNKHIEPYEVLLPRLDEQRTIGKFFKDVDNLITLHQRKLEKLQNLKKAMLERMFI